jgi:hypothetical protein
VAAWDDLCAAKSGERKGVEMDGMYCEVTVLYMDRKIIAGMVCYV